MKKLVTVVLTAFLSCVGTTGYAACAAAPPPRPVQAQPFAPARPYAGEDAMQAARIFQSDLWQPAAGEEGT